MKQKGVDKMAQLIMNWTKKDDTEIPFSLKESMEWKTFPELKNAEEEWLKIVCHMEQNQSLNPEENRDLYKKTMSDRTDYREENCFFITVQGKPAATITVLYDETTKTATVHMVACKPEYRGLGIGTLLAIGAKNRILRLGAEQATLQTDDWRIPAIKTYKKIGFVPDRTSHPTFEERWQKIDKILVK
jgi:mycothiol synthase